jgi:hypothetical protein
MMHPILQQINDLSPQEFEDLRSEIENTLQKKAREADQRRLRERARKNEDRQARERLVGEAAERWCQANLITGMVVKVKGARDGHGLRQVITIQGNELLGWQVTPRKVKKLDDDGNVVTNPSTGRPVYETHYHRYGQTTTNMLNKVREVQVKGTWRKITELMNV